MALGAISFEKQEVRFELDDNGNPQEVYFKESKQANKLIEEFMLFGKQMSCCVYRKTEKRLCIEFTTNQT